MAAVVLSVSLYGHSSIGQLDTPRALSTTLQIFLTACVAYFNLSIPRRPGVFRNGSRVDRENAASFLEWLSFSWVESLLKIAKKSPLQMSDLPELCYSLRTESGSHIYRQMIESGHAGARGLWMVILRSHSRHLICQAFVAVTLSVLSFVPLFFLMKILAGLEERQKGETSSARLWMFVTLLGLSTIVVAALETLKYWIPYNKLTIGVQERLTVAIFDKAVRLYVGRTVKKDKCQGSDPPQNRVNTAAIDAKNVADFMCWFFQLYETPLKLTIASVFLFRLLGWNGLPYLCRRGLHHELRQLVHRQEVHPNSRQTDESPRPKSGDDHRGSSGDPTSQVLCP